MNADINEEKEKDDNIQFSDKINEAWLFIWEIVKIVVISLVIILPIRYWVAQPFFVKGASMEPNFYSGDYLIVNEITYQFNTPRRGDVIVFRFPQGQKEFFIKRIIALPGETIEIKDSIITIFNNGHPEGMKLDQSKYLSSATITPRNLKTKLDENEFFVLGDNRSKSYDSGDWGPLQRALIIGKAWIRLWPFDKVGVIKN